MRLAPGAPRPWTPRMLLITNYYKEWDGKNKGKFVNLYVICTGEKKGTGPFPENGGKKQLQKGKIDAYVIGRATLADPQYAKKIGVDIDNLYISQPDNGEQALEIAETMIRSGALDIVIVDSVAALVPKAEIEGDMDDQQVGLHARLMSKAMRKLTGVINRSNCAVVFINQLREKVGYYVR